MAITFYIGIACTDITYICFQPQLFKIAFIKFYLWVYIVAANHISTDASAHVPSDVVMS